MEGKYVCAWHKREWALFGTLPILGCSYSSNCLPKCSEIFSPPPSLPVKPIYNLEAAGGGTLLRDTKIRSSSISSLFGLHIKFYLSNFVCSLSLSLSHSQMSLTRGEVLRERESDIEREREREREREEEVLPFSTDTFHTTNTLFVKLTLSLSFSLTFFGCL